MVECGLFCFGKTPTTVALILDRYGRPQSSIVAWKRLAQCLTATFARLLLHLHRLIPIESEVEAAKLRSFSLVLR